MKRLSLLILMLALPQAVTAAWLEASSANFLVYADDSERNLRKVSEQLELYHQALERVTSFDAHFAAEIGVRRNVEIIVPSYQLLPDLVIGTERIATLQTRLAHQLAAVRPIKVLPLPVPLPRFEEAMVWHPRFEGDEAHQWFRGRLLHAAAAMQPVAT